MLLCPFYISIDKIIIIYVLEFLNGHIDITDYVQIYVQIYRLFQGFKVVCTMIKSGHVCQNVNVTFGLQGKS